MRKQLIKRYDEGGAASKNGSPSSTNSANNGTYQFKNQNAPTLKMPEAASLTNGLNLDGSINFSGDNPYQYKGLGTNFQNKAAQNNINNLLGRDGKTGTGRVRYGSLLDKIQGFGQGAWDAIGGASGAANLAGNVVDAVVGKADINSGAYETVDNILGVAQNLPIVGKYAQFLKLGMNAINNLGATKLAEVRKDQGVTDTLARSDGGYGNFRNLWDKASANSGKKVGFFTSSDKYNKEIWNANAQMTTLEGITERQHDNDVLTAQMGDRWNERTMVDMNGGFGNISFGRLGLKIDILPKVHAILNAPKVVATLTEYEEETPLFKEGGKMNVIPEGSLHARLHHMENADGLTKKGIPVVSIQEGEQQAEIELNEIIFRLEVTKKIEKLMEDGSESAAIEAGKLLVEEIFENTDDRTGLIDTLKPEEKKQTTEDIIKNHQVFKLGGIIEKLDTLSDEELQELRKYLKIEEA